MRPKGRGPLESIYFTYPHFEPPEARQDKSSATPVAIVGAGPVGMVAALELARHGHRSILIDDKDTFNDGSRAICVARASYHILERMGALQPFLDKSLPWTTGRTLYRGAQILEFDMPDSANEKFRPMYNLQQQYIEDFLWQAVARQPLIEARWQTRATGIATTEHGAVLTLQDPNGSYELPARYVLAADGARSTIRSLMNLRLKGQNFEGRYVIADVRMQHDYPTIRRALFDPDCRRGGTVLIHRQPDDIWRIDYQLRDGETVKAATSEAAVRASVQGVLCEIGHNADWDLEWWSIYSANTLALDDYRHGPVFFIGDSAHIVPIFGVRGLNNGIADAQNIGWKLALVLDGRAGEGVLDSYSPERRGATLDVFANASKSARFMTPPTAGWLLMRDAALSLSLSQSWAGQLANPRQMAPYIYDQSPLTSASTHRGPKAGAMIPDADLGDRFLSDDLGPLFTLVCFGEAPDVSHPLLKVVVQPADGPAAKVWQSQAGDCWLIRPDLHIAAHWDSVQPRQVTGFLDQILERSA